MLISFVRWYLHLFFWLFFRKEEIIHILISLWLWFLWIFCSGNIKEVIKRNCFICFSLNWTIYFSIRRSGSPKRIARDSLLFLFRKIDYFSKLCNIILIKGWFGISWYIYEKMCVWTMFGNRFVWKWFKLGFLSSWIVFQSLLNFKQLIHRYISIEIYNFFVENIKLFFFFFLFLFSSLCLFLNTKISTFKGILDIVFQLFKIVIASLTEGRYTGLGVNKFLIRSLILSETWYCVSYGYLGNL